ncbi:unnamed protein product, partial [Rotaria socialis]
MKLVKLIQQMEQLKLFQITCNDWQIQDNTKDYSFYYGIQPTQISVSSMNQSAMNEFHEELNSQTNFREYLNEFTINLPVITINSIKLQLSTLIQLTQTTNQLTRKPF